MKACIHPELNFASGDYYVTCAKCNAMWMRKSAGTRPEYGFDHQGRQIGAAPDEANGNVNAMVAGPRVLQQRQENNEREMAEGTRCDGSCNDGLPCHC